MSDVAFGRHTSQCSNVVCAQTLFGPVAFCPFCGVGTSSLQSAHIEEPKNALIADSSVDSFIVSVPVDVVTDSSIEVMPQPLLFPQPLLLSAVRRKYSFNQKKIYPVLTGLVAGAIVPLLVVQAVLWLLLGSLLLLSALKIFIALVAGVVCFFVVYSKDEEFWPSGIAGGIVGAVVYAICNSSAHGSEYLFQISNNLWQYWSTWALLGAIFGGLAAYGYVLKRFK